MSKYSLIPFILISVLTSKSFAFDPFTALTAAGSVSSIFSSAKGISDTAGDLSNFSDLLGSAAETFDELDGLNSDLGNESASNELSQKAEKLEKLNSELRTLKWTSDDLKYTLDSDINSTRTLSQKIKQMRKIISISKKLASTFGLKAKGSDKVATLQQVKISSMMLDELQAMRKMQLLGYLENKERIAKQDIYLNRLITEEKSRLSIRRNN